MFLALRDMRHAPGRFALIGAVIALMMLLVGFLAGLTGGLAAQNISALLNTGASTVVSEQKANTTFAWSTASVTEAQVDAWSAAGAEVTPLGVATTRLEHDSDNAAVTLFAEPGSMPSNELTLAPKTADTLGVTTGDTVKLAGVDFTVTTISDTGDYSHTPVARISLDDFHAYLERTQQPAIFANVLLVTGEVANADALAAETGTQQQSLLSSLLGLEAFKSEIGTLGMMIGMLFGIAALVVGVFFLVWSMQRQRDVAVLKALGASNSWLRKDALGQAALVLLLAIVAGAALALGLGAAISGVAPFVIAWWTILPPAVAMLVAGLIGSLISLRQIDRADPLTALNAAA